MKTNWNVLSSGVAFLLALSGCGGGAGEGGEEVTNGPVTISSVSPASGARGTWVTLAGTGFTDETAVSVGDSPCSAIQFVSAAELRCRVARASSTVAGIVARNGDGPPAELREAFQYRNYLFVANSQERTILSFPLNGSWGEGDRYPSDAAAPAQVALDPLGRFLFVISQSIAAEKAIYVYRIDPERGALTSVVRTETTELPLHLTVDSSGKYLAVSANPSGGSKANLLVYAISEEGALGLVGRQEGLTGRRAIFSPDAKFLHQSVASMTKSLVTKAFDVASGGVAPAGEGPEISRALALAMDPGGTFLFAVTDFNARLQSFRREGGTLAPVSNLTLPGENGEKFLAVHPTRPFLYALTVGLQSCNVYAWSATGTLSSKKAECEAGNASAEIAFDPSGARAFISDVNENHVKAFDVQADGSLAPATTLQAGGGASGLAVD